MRSARSLSLAVLLVLLALAAAPLAAAPCPGEQPAAPAVDTAAAAAPEAPPAPLPWELPEPQQKCQTTCYEGTCTMCVDCTGHCLGISCPWGDFQC
jgi:hypothetical protein